MSREEMGRRWGSCAAPWKRGGPTEGCSKPSKDLPPWPSCQASSGGASVLAAYIICLAYTIMPSPINAPSMQPQPVSCVGDPQQKPLMWRVVEWSARVTTEINSSKFNLKIIRLPNGIEGGNPTAFVTKLLYKIFREEALGPPPLIYVNALK